jgi:hypothetical protein
MYVIPLTAPTGNCCPKSNRINVATAQYGRRIDGLDIGARNQNILFAGRRIQLGNDGCSQVGFNNRTILN